MAMLKLKSFVPAFYTDFNFSFKTMYKTLLT